MEKRIQIIHAAMKLLIDNGVQATPMSAIAKEAGSGMGTIYNYFPTKEELINAVYIYIKQDEIGHILVPFTDESIKKQFDHYYSGLAMYFIEHPDYFRFMDQFHNSPIVTEATRNEGMRAIAPFMQLIAKGQQQGIIKSIGSDELLAFLNGGLMGFVRWVLTNTITVNDIILENQLRIAWDAVKQ